MATWREPWRGFNMTLQTAPQLVTAFFGRAVHAWVEITEALGTTFASCDNATFQAEYPATNFILSYMRDLKTFQSIFGSLFRRQKRPPAADDFTAAVALALVQFLAARGFPNRVRSEQKTHGRRGATRPDISIRSDSEKLLATVECKTNLGWAREEWKDQCEKRTAALQGMFPGCTSYLCVLSASNWDTSEFTTSPSFGKHWFCLYRLRPGLITNPVSPTDILTPIEPMFLSILRALQTEGR
jgi:hypothetical protein